MNEMTLKEIDNQIQELQFKRRELYKKEIEDFQNDARKHIGRCFKISDKEYAKVIGVPKEDFDGSFHLYFNKYQFPAFLITSDDELPFCIDILYSAAWGDRGNDYDYGTYEEITEDEFDCEFKKRLTQLYDKYSNIKE